MRGHTKPRRHTRVTHVLVMASTASAMSLANFELITSPQVPLGCILTYDAQLRGCSSSDFTQGQTCSASCSKALQNIQEALVSVCDGVSVPSTSLLGLALSGGLVERLCPSGKAATTSSKPSTAVVITPTTRAIGTFSSIPAAPTTLQKSTTTSSSSTDVQESETEAPTSTSSPEAAAQPTETAPSTDVAPAPAVTSSPVANPPHTTKAQQTKAPPQTGSDKDSGGGSPFDIARASSSGAPHLTGRWLEGFLFAYVLLFWLWR